ncbi:MAG TPA: hypothetical protein VKG84_11810 [Candidatus Acidoferrales bacterium]|nr:hypothetical protein [Candidatus Acidoferrales bacterium]
MFESSQAHHPLKLALASPGINRLCAAILTLLGCWAVAAILHEPVPRIHDEFGYVLLGDTLAHGRFANPSPPLPEFFDTFHVLVRPVYASKYFPAQGIFIAIGQKLTGHPAVGVWLSSALAVAATMWMLEVWIGPGWALLGGLLMFLQWGVYSYWSQTYWGGMPAALGGALAFGAARRLWDELSWKNSALLALGIVILVNSRPLEGFLALLPVTVFFISHVLREGLWRRRQFWSNLILPAMILLALGAFLTCSYNRAITGSPWKPPMLLHGEQYQEAPQFSFLPLGPKLSYSSPWVARLYEVDEMRLYQAKRDPRLLVTGLVTMFASWWQFYCGILLSVPLVLPGLLRRGGIRYLQAALLIALALLWFFADPGSVLLRGVFDLLVLGQIALLWVVFEGFWPRLAVGTTALVLLESLFVKWFFQHYFAPAACLVLYLEVEGLRRMWHWNPQPGAVRAQSPGARRAARSPQAQTPKPGESPALWPRKLVVALLVLCAVSLVWKVETRIHGFPQGNHDPDVLTLRLKDWSLQRAAFQQWLELRPSPQLVFVRYSPQHDINEEWVYNHADILHAQVIWARDLGVERNRGLIEQLPDRTVWLLEPEGQRAQLIPYARIDPRAPQTVPLKPVSPAGQDKLNW